MRREFVACYRDEFAFVWRALLRLGVARWECDDAAQDVFVTAHRRWATLRGDIHPRAWLFGIVRRIAWRHRRTRERRERRLDALVHAPSVRVDLDEEIARREAWSALAGFLDGLDEEKRAAFVLGELDELGRNEMGAALGISPNTAYSRLQAARRSFFSHFADYEDDAVAHLLARATMASDAPVEAQRRAWIGIVAVLGAPIAASSSLSTVGWVAIALAVATGAGTVAVAATPDPVSAVQPMTIAPHVDPPRPAPSIGDRGIERIATPPGGNVVVAAPTSPVAPPRRATPPTPGPPTIDEEVATLVAARSAIVAGDLAKARERLDEHRRTFGDRASLGELRAEIERTLADAVIDPTKGGDSIQVEHDP